MTHQELSELYELYALGALEPNEAAELEEHLARNCPQCQAGVRQAAAMGALFGTLADSVAPPRRLKRRILASVGVEPESGHIWLGALGLLSACLAIGLIWVGIQDARRGDDLARARKDLTKLDAALQLLNEPETEQVVFGKGQPTPPRGRVFVNPRRGVLLMASNLPSAPAGKLYEMWLVPRNGAPIPAGLFQPDANGNALYLRKQPFDLGATKAVAVTLEPEAGSAAPTAPLVIAAAL